MERYSYSQFGTSATKKLAFERAKIIHKKLIEQGISPSRLQVVGKTDLPPGIETKQPSWLMRCVVVEAFSEDKN
ncbi:MAG: hypothetical protein HC836_38990 [Richelia sp. RM2_1_2]|nr:hypothetical protein [Richelia sp. SM2_1_7]NJM22290.1 hypothetical protein [Richelia sp. SM1_7_0]NJO63957.1 hypothetical protein [Richelia sp. RM2_1_2]NJS16647.1 hypothetical protein [Nostocaceae cyanobacterium CSU_2_110]